MALSPHGSDGRGRGTWISVGEARAQILLDAIWACSDIERVEDIRDRLPQFRMWTSRVYEDALDRLVATGRLVETCDGRLVAQRGRAA